jgi:hypothetical protein
MAEEVEQPKKKVYVETTVVSDATAHTADASGRRL